MSKLALHRRLICRRYRCAHDLALCEDPAAACPNGRWTAVSIEPPLPSLPRRAANLAGAVARDLAAGLPKRSESEIANILTICAGCPQFRHSDRTCASCGCPMARKAAMAVERCPLGKW